LKFSKVFQVGGRPKFTLNRVAAPFIYLSVLLEAAIPLAIKRRGVTENVLV
jgi:hypothetical protein